MATYTKDDRRRGLEYANRLADLAKDAPDDFSKSRTRSAVREIRQKFGFSDAEKMAMIRHSIRLGCSSYQDVVDETRLPKEQVVELVGGMTDITVTPLGAGTGGRPAMFLRLTAAE